MIKFLKKYAWYPPAETKIPLHAILGALCHSTDKFEKILCNYLKVDKCILGNSGRALLYQLLKTLKRKDGGIRDEVLIPGYTCCSVAASIAKAGLKIAIYDLDPRTLNPDIDSARKAASNKTLAIIFQHLFGIPTSSNDIKGIAQESGAYLIEDAAQALGGSIDGFRLGTIGEFGFYSFGRGKSLPLGSGGALIGKDGDVLQELQLNPGKVEYSKIAATAATQAVSKPPFYWIAEMLPLGLGETIFDPGFDVSSMPLVMKNLAEKSMEVLDDLNAHRRYIAKIHDEAFDDDYVIPIPERTIPVYTRFPLVVSPDPIPKELKRLGIRRMYPHAIVDESTIRPYLIDDLVPTPGSSEIARNLITLPTHKGITETLTKEIAWKVKETFYI